MIFILQILTIIAYNNCYMLKVPIFDFQVRYYCGNNVVDWYADLFITHDELYSDSYFVKDIDQTKSLIHQPALYDSQGLKLAECATSFELNGVTKQIQVIYLK